MERTILRAALYVALAASLAVAAFTLGPGKTGPEFLPALVLAVLSLVGLACSARRD